MSCTFKSPFNRFAILICLCVASVNWSQAQQPAAPGEMNNARVIEMTKLGLGDDVIIARIKTGQTNFSLSDTDLLALKDAGVSDKVVAAMLEAGVLREPKASVDGQSLEQHTLGQSKVGGRLGRALTIGVKSAKTKAYLQGAHASVFVSPNPTIELQLPASDSIDNYILVRMDDKDDRRELEVASAGGVVGEKAGLRAESIVRTSYTAVANDVFHVKPTSRLERGEYLLYVLGSMDTIKGIYGKGYDFTVE